MQLKSLRYLDLILTKEPTDKFKFYKGLAAKIESFSPTLLRIKILPALLAECEKDARFAPVLLGPILYIGKAMPSDEFQRSIWTRLAFLTTITKPPEIAIALLRNIQTILKKVERHLRKDFVYPIVITTLQSTDPKIHREVLSQIPNVIAEMSDSTVYHMLLPRLLDLAGACPDPANTSDAVRCVAECLAKVDHDVFVVEVLGHFVQIWARAKSAAVATAIIAVLERIDGAADLLMAKAVPLAADIAGFHGLDEYVRGRLCDWMITTVQKFKVNRATVQRRSGTSDPDNPFGETAPPTGPPPQPQEPVKRTSGLNLTSDDIFGPPKPDTARPVEASAKALSTVDGFGPPPKQPTPIEVFAPRQPTPSGPRSSAPIDVFGPSPTAAKPPVPIDVFGPSPTAAKSPVPIDLFGPSPAGPKPSGQMDVFGTAARPPSSRDIFGPPPADAFGGPGPAGDVEVFGPRPGRPAVQEVDIFGGSATPVQNDNSLVAPGFSAPPPRASGRQNDGMVDVFGQQTRSQVGRPPPQNHPRTGQPGGAVDDLLNLF
jgi:hypothetical protein